MKFTIELQDYKKSEKNFSSIYNCPLAQAARRQLDVKDPKVGTNCIYDHADRVGGIDPPFDEDAFAKCQKKWIKGQECVFETEFTPNGN